MQKLQTLFDLGYQIKIEAGSYETGFVTMMGLVDEDEEESDDNPRVFSDEFHEDSPLRLKFPSEIRVFREINFRLEEPELQEEVYYYEN